MAQLSSMLFFFFQVAPCLGPTVRKASSQTQDPGHHLEWIHDFSGPHNHSPGMFAIVSSLTSTRPFNGSKGTNTGLGVSGRR